MTLRIKKSLGQLCIAAIGGLVLLGTSQVDNDAVNYVGGVVGAFALIVGAIALFALTKELLSED